MFLEDRKEFNFEKEYFKILHAAPAYNESLCFLGMREFRVDCLTHMDKDGKVLREIVFEHNTDSFAMLTDRQAAVLLPQINQLLVWNLDTYEEIRIPFEFKGPEADQSRLHVFPETNLLCVQENGRSNNNTFKLSYYQYPVSQGAKPVKVWDTLGQGLENVWTYDYSVQRANTHSMLVWFKSRHDEGFDFRTYDLRSPQGEYKHYKFPNEIGKPYGMAKVETCVNHIWEMRPLEFIFVCFSNRTEPKDCVNNNYVYDAKTNVMREAKFNFGKYQEFTTDQMAFGGVSVFRSFEFKDGKVLPTPIYYIDNDKQEIFHDSSKWQCSYLYKYNVIGSDPNALVEMKYENGKVLKLELAVIKVLSPKEIWVHFLTELIDDCDDNLVFEVIEMLDTK